MEVLFNEQDVIDSVCVAVAARERIAPENVDVDLEFNPSYGFAANARFIGGMFRHNETRRLNEQEVIDAVAFYLREWHNFNPEQLKVDLQFNEKEGIGASIIKLNY